MESDRLGEELHELGDPPLRSKRDAVSVVEALRRLPRVEKRPLNGYRMSRLHSLAVLFQEVDGEAAYEVLQRDGIPELQRIFDASLPASEDDDDDHLFVLKVLAMYRAPGLLETLQRAIRDPLLATRFLWSVILGSLAEDEALRPAIIDALRDPLPQGNAGEAFLELCNQVAAAGELAEHPFDNEEGVARLIAMLDSGDGDRALIAAAAIPFLPDSDPEPLLERASTHADRYVRLECEWAYAKLGDEHGIVELARAAQDPRTATRARAYLEELDRPEAIPRSANEPAFLALAEMSDWLAYPTEFGTPPDSLRLVDTRELFWPPTNDTRRLYLIEYIYEPNDERTARESGLGMVGSITFALFDTVPADLPPEDAYAFHCCWELQVKEDPRAEGMSVEDGKRLLGF